MFQEKNVTGCSGTKKAIRILFKWVDSHGL